MLIWMRLLIIGAVLLSGAALAESRATFDEAEYVLPDVALVRHDGKSVRLDEELNDGKPVILTFVFTSCATVCPVAVQTLLGVQKRLGASRDTVHVVAISIDPEEDTPARLRDFAQKFNVGPQWDFYTGTRKASIAVQQAFDTFRGNKMNHEPLIFMRSAPGERWIRIEGFPRPEEIIKRYRLAVASN